MIVVGGTYVEICDCPADRTIAGSGLRAAGALSAIGDVVLHTAVDADLREEAEIVAGGLGVPFHAVPRDQRVSFRYFTPLSSPTIDGPAAVHDEPLNGDDDTVLAFGMIERGPRRIRCRNFVLDPQRPRDLAGVSLEGIVADRVALVCNRAEVRAIGRSDDLVEAARSAGTSLNADVVVVKRGAVGCTVVEVGSVTHIGPRPTETVWPIGSGDVFAAAFAQAWGGGVDSRTAAEVGSAAAGWWCGTRNATVPAGILAGGADVLATVGPALPLVDGPTVYLAGPFFCLAERWQVETARDSLAGLGADAFSPFHDVGSGGDEVAVADLDGLGSAGSVLALVDGFDAGTLYECGWARRAGIPVVAFGADAGAEGAKMLVGAGAELHADFASAVYRSVWAAMGAPLTPGRVSGPLE